MSGHYCWIFVIFTMVGPFAIWFPYRAFQKRSSKDYRELFFDLIFGVSAAICGILGLIHHFYWCR